MVKIGLQIKASLENIADLRPSDGSFLWTIKTKCTSCGEECPNWVYLSLEEAYPLKNSRGEANLIMKCKLCGRENYILIEKDSIRAYTKEDSDDFKTIVVFDCRGLEPIDFDPKGGYVATGLESGTIFENIEFIDGEWADYDETAKESVSIMDLTHKFVKI